MARLGDGEQSIAVCHTGARGQNYDPALSKALRLVAATNFKKLLVCIPDLWRGIPAAKHRWERWARPERTKIFNPDQTYGNAFISRPDFWGPDHKFGADYWALVRSLWDGRSVLLVRGDTKIPALFDNAGSLDLMRAPNRDAWASYHDVLAECLTWAAEHKGGLVIAQLGPTATVLAHDLAIRGVQCLDLGKADRFYRNEIEERAA